MRLKRLECLLLIWNDYTFFSYIYLEVGAPISLKAAIKYSLQGKNSLKA